jgi:hypothetical protein
MHDVIQDVAEMDLLPTCPSHYHDLNTLFDLIIALGRYLKLILVPSVLMSPSPSGVSRSK